MYKIVMCAGAVKQDMMRGLTYDAAQSVCEDYGWFVAPDGPGGFEWDLEIEEE